MAVIVEIPSRLELPSTADPAYQPVQKSRVVQEAPTTVCCQVVFSTVLYIVYLTG